MDRTIRVLIFGSCGLHIPTIPFIQQRFLHYPFSKRGYLWAPFALSSGAAVQFFEAGMGERPLSEAVRTLAYVDKDQPTPGARETFDTAEIALVELSTPIEPMIGNDVVNLHRIGEAIFQPLRSWGTDSKILSNWWNCLRNSHEKLDQNRDILLANWPLNASDDGLARFGVENLWCRRLGVDEMVGDLEYLRERLKVPVVLKLFDFIYTPDGRPIDWPTGFKAEQVEVARRMDLPTLDVAPIVKRLGVGRLITDDMKHWRLDACPLQGQLMHDALADALGRPRLESYPESLGLRREVDVMFPELAELGAPISFPGVLEIPPDFKAEPRTDVAPRARAALPAELADGLNAVLVNYHRDRSKDAHYLRVLERGSLVGSLEERTLELITWHLPPYDTYGVMRAGLGELALLIAASGRQALAFEPYGPRRSAIEAGRTLLEDAGLLAPGLLTVVGALAPEAPASGRMLGIGLNVAQFLDESAAAPDLERMANFEALLIIPRIFLRIRDPKEQADLAERLVGLGFDGRRDYPGDVFSWFFRSDRQLTPRGRVRDLTEARTPPG
jgi:hypothetical protein